MSAHVQPTMDDIGGTGSAISAKTTLYGVLGSPVRHSLSPRMQTAPYRAP